MGLGLGAPDTMPGFVADALWEPEDSQAVKYAKAMLAQWQTRGTIKSYSCCCLDGVLMSVTIYYSDGVGLSHCASVRTHTSTGVEEKCLISITGATKP